MKRLKMVVLVLLSALIALLVGCSGGGTTDDPNKGNGGNKTEAKTINIWISTVNQPKYFMGWFEDAFEAANEGIDLNFIPSTNLGLGLDVTLNGAGAPDMVATSGGLVVPTLKAGNRILKLEDVLGDKKSTFHDVALLNQIDNELWCAPIFGFASPVVYYNKTVFEQNHFTAPTTYAELVALCNQIRGIKDSNNNQKYQTIVTGYTYHVLQGMSGKTMTDEQIAAIVAPKTSEAKNPFDNVGMENTFKWVDKMREDNIFATNLTGYTTVSAANNFSTQKALMIMAPGLDLLDLSGTCNFEIGSFILPDAPAEFSQEGVRSGTVAGIYNDCMVVNAKTQYPAECKKVIEFMYSETAQQELLNCFLYPVVKNIDDSRVDASVKDLFDSAFKPVYEKVCANGMTTFWMNYFYKTGLDSGCEQTFNGVLNGTKSVAAAWNEMKNNW